MSIFKIFNLLSFDVAISSLGTAYLASIVTHTYPLLLWWILVPTFTFLAFNADHLFDVVFHNNAALSYRYQFHVRYRNELFVIVLFISLILLTVLFFISPNLFFLAIFGALAFFCHMLLLHFKLFSFTKELRVALIYTGVIWAYPVILNTTVSMDAILNAFLLFIGICLINLYTLSYLDYELDMTSGFDGINSILSKRYIRILSFVLGVCLNVYILFFSKLWYSLKLSFLSMTFLLTIAVILKESFLKCYYRKISEWVFLLPFFIFIFF